MLNEEICKLRDKLNKSIEDGDDYAITYKLSVELDALIAKYYRDSKNSKKKLVADFVWISMLFCVGSGDLKWLSFFLFLPLLNQQKYYIILHQVKERDNVSK